MPLPRPPELVLGTAGHIDHGKTSLVRALTGTDTDRLPEEKRRGISIDIGFAHLSLPNGAVVSFVDVPGHERFVRNMVAGAVGIQAVLLVVAATESVMPQTREHFDVCRLLGIEKGCVVLTKCDLAAADQIHRAEHDVRAMCLGSFLEAAPIIRTSVVSGLGLQDIRTTVAQLQAELSGSAPSQFPRLPVDRSFTLPGFGRVITGTLVGGCLQPGMSAVLQPGSRPVRIRGLQVHGMTVDEAAAGERTAVNLAGIDGSSIQRGDVLTTGDLLQAASELIVKVSWLSGHKHPTSHEPVNLHTGTAEVSARVKILGEGLAQLRLLEPVLALPGDRFVLRRASPAQTIGGGVIVDLPPAGRRARIRKSQRLLTLSEGSLPERLQLFVKEGKDGASLTELVRRTGLTPGALLACVKGDPQLLWHEPSQRVLSQEWVATWRKRISDWLADFHRENPSKASAPLSMGRRSLPPSLSAMVFTGWPEVRIQGESIALAAHRPQANAAEQRALLQLESVFLRAGFSPPSVTDALQAAVPDPRLGLALLEQLLKAQRLVRVGPDLVFHGDVVAHIRTSLAQHKGRRFSVPDFKQWTNISRKYAIPLLEYLDRQRVTRRDGDARIVL